MSQHFAIFGVCISVCTWSLYLVIRFIQDTGSTYVPFVMSSISSSTFAFRWFLPGTWPVLNSISNLCTSSRERAFAMAAWK